MYILVKSVRMTTYNSASMKASAIKFIVSMYFYYTQVKLFLEMSHAYFNYLNYDFQAKISS